MDPLTQEIVDVLAKYAVDRGITLAKEAGQAAKDAAAELFHKVIDRLKQDPAEAKNADRFENNPEGYKAPIADALDEKLRAEADFAAEVQALLSQYQRAIVTAISHSGAGDLFVGDHNVKVGENKGTIIVGGSGHRVSTTRSGGTDIDAESVDISGDVTGRDKTTG